MSEADMDSLLTTLFDGDQARAIAEAKKLLHSGFSRARIVTEGIEVAMTQLDAKCTVEQFNLLEIMLVGRAAVAVMKEMYPAHLQGYPPKSKGVVVIATLEGDIHDLGKNILKMILTAKGYQVVDCGRDCSVEKLIDIAKREAAMAVGVSGLITPVIPYVRQIKEMLANRGLGNIKVMAGGGALKQSSAESLNVDFVAETAFDGVRYLAQIAGTV